MTAEQTVIAEENHVKAPWLAFYGVVPAHLDYPDCTMYEAVERCAEKYPNNHDKKQKTANILQWVVQGKSLHKLRK